MTSFNTHNSSLQFTQQVMTAGSTCTIRCWLHLCH